MRILYKFPSRSRFQKMLNACDNIKKMSASNDYHIMLTLDTDDESIDNISLRDYIQENGNISAIFGKSLNKIHAINRNLDEAPQFDILVCMSDDMEFIQHGFDNVIREAFGSNLDQFIHFNDGNQKSNLCTMSIMGVDYYNRFKYIYHPDYKSLWCDMEATEVSKILGKYKYMGDHVNIVRHNHPAWGLAQYDAQYQKTESKDMWNHDEQVYLRRKANNFDL